MALSLTVLYFGKILAAILFRWCRDQLKQLRLYFFGLRNYVIGYRLGVRFSLQLSRLVTDFHLGPAHVRFYVNFWVFFRMHISIVCCWLLEARHNTYSDGKKWQLRRKTSVTCTGVSNRKRFSKENLKERTYLSKHVPVDQTLRNMRGHSTVA